MVFSSMTHRLLVRGWAVREGFRGAVEVLLLAVEV
jgi:hypothetical protein